MTDDPTDADLLDGQWIKLSRVPATNAARSLTDAAVAMMIEHTDSKRAIGSGKRASMTDEAAMILGGLLHGAASDNVVSAQRGHAGGMWQHAPVKRTAFWSRIGEMERAGLVGQRLGTQGSEVFDKRHGYPTRLWTTKRLQKMLNRHDIKLWEIDRHWRLSKAAQETRLMVSEANLAQVSRLGDWAGLEASEAVLEDMRRNMRLLNDLVAAAKITGCVFPAFERRFIGDARLHGRIYAVGSDTYQNARKAERRRLTINGEPAVEVDAKASQLSIFLTMTGWAGSLPADPYDIAGLPREAVKTFCTQTFGAGRVPGRWNDDAKAAVKAIKLSVVKAAVLAAYPAMADPTVILPDDLKAAPPPKGLGWASGQFLVWRESEALTAALASLMADGVVALPLHDGLIVPASAAHEAREALSAAYVSVLGVNARVELKEAA